MEKKRSNQQPKPQRSGRKRRRRRYSAAFKKEIIEYVKERRNESVEWKDIAFELGLPVRLLNRWCRMEERKSAPTPRKRKDGNRASSPAKSPSGGNSSTDDKGSGNRFDGGEDADGGSMVVLMSVDNISLHTEAIRHLIKKLDRLV